MAFGSLVPGMTPVQAPQIQPNQMMKLGSAMLGRPSGQSGLGGLGGVAGQPQQGLLQRLLAPAAAPTDLAAPGMPPNAGPGILSRLFPGLTGGLGGAPMGGAAMGAMPNVGTPGGMGGLY